MYRFLWKLALPLYYIAYAGLENISKVISKYQLKSKYAQLMIHNVTSKSIIELGDQLYMYIKHIS